jgi:hypothetical protein
MSVSGPISSPEEIPPKKELDVPDEQPFRGPFFQQIAKRKRQGRDAKILLTADNAATGVGKTSCAVYLAKVLDTTATGFDAAEQATLNVPQFLDLYDELPPGSAAILDEAEQLDSRRAMSNENVDASERWQTRRVQQIITILTMPSVYTIDPRMEHLADYWVNVEVRGRARIYEKKIHRIKQSIYYQTLQTFQWPSMDGDRDYQRLAQMKDEFIGDEDDDANYVRESEVQERVKKAVKKAEREKRDEFITNAAEQGLNYPEIAPIVGLSANRVGQIVRGE